MPRPERRGIVCIRVIAHLDEPVSPACDPVRSQRASQVGVLPPDIHRSSNYRPEMAEFATPLFHYSYYAGLRVAPETSSGFEWQVPSDPR